MHKPIFTGHYLTSSLQWGKGYSCRVMMVPFRFRYGTEAATCNAFTMSGVVDLREGESLEQFGASRRYTTEEKLVIALLA